MTTNMVMTTAAVKTMHPVRPPGPHSDPVRPGASASTLLACLLPEPLGHGGRVAPET